MRPPRILIVDNDPKDLVLYAKVLSKARYIVYRASGYAEATAILKKHRGKIVVLSELNANGECGLEFLRDTLKAYPCLPFLFLASSPSLDSVIEALKRGAYDFLRKPVAPDILCHSVARSVQRMNLTLETEKQEREIRKLLSSSQEDLRIARNLSSFKGFMISMAAHDFRSIITVLDGYLQFLTEKCHGCPVSEPHGMIYQASRTITRLRTMAHTLLDFEAAETGRIRLEIRPFSLEDALLECADFYRPYADQKDIRLSLDIDGPKIMVKGDRVKVMEILDNLIYNALKFTPVHGSIRLSGKKERGEATISVSDSGPGIPKEKLRKLFSRDDMVATLDSHARLGLGMTICKKLVEAQQGKIWVESTLGKGTDVFFSLPAI
ncbi:MAG: response regulator [Anaerolineales bacterium]|nr:response regulator [Anaerolineales bacterium]